MKRKNVTKVLALSLAATVAVGNNPVEVSAKTSPQWKSTVSKLTVGKTAKFKVKNIPTKGKVVFSSSNKAVATVGKTNGTVKAKKAGKTVIKAVIINRKRVKVKVLKKTLQVVKKSGQKVSTGVTINKAYNINNKDFTIAVSGLKKGKSLTEFVKADIEKEVSNSSLTLKGQGLTLKANYVSYSADTGMITYRMDESSIKALKTHDNGGVVGSADGQYIITATGVKVSGNLTVSYVEELFGNSVSGYIYDRDTKLPVAGAQVSATVGETDTKTTTSDATGYYYLTSTAGVAKVKVQTTGSMKDKYFLTTNDNVNVNNNNKTACNMYLDTYDEQELFINGKVKSKDTSANVNNAVEGAIVTLYQTDDKGVEKKLKSVTTDATGCFVFANSKAYNTEAYSDMLTKYGIADGKSGKVVKFKYGEGINKDYTYHIEISKKLSKKNITDVYETKKTKEYTFSNNRAWNLDVTGDSMLTPVAKTDTINLNVNWASADILPTAATATLNVKFMYESTPGVFTALKSGKIEVNIDKDTKAMSKVYNLAAEKFFDSAGKYPTLPTGTYYVTVDDGQSTATEKNKVTAIVTSGKIDLTAGSACTVPNVTISEAKSTTINVSCSVAKDASLANQTSGSTTLAVQDTKGTVIKDENVNVSFKYYYVDTATNNIVYITKEDKGLVFKKENSANSVSATTAITRTIAGATYEVDPTPSYVTADQLKFTQSSDSASTETLKSCKGAANLAYVKVANISRLKVEEGEEAIKATDTLKVNKVALYDAATNSEVGSYTYSTPNKVTVSDLTGSGMSIADSITALKGIAPGKYYVTLDIEGFKTAKSDSFDVIDFQKVTATIDNDIAYKTKTSIVGTILTKAEGMDIQDKDAKTIDATLLLYNKKGVIVGATTYGNKTYTDGKLKTKYAFIDGENACLTNGEEYTLVLRSGRNANQIAFETVATKVTAKADEKIDLPFVVTTGANAGVTVTATDTNNNALKNGKVYLVDTYFKKYHIENENIFKEFTNFWNIIDGSLASEEIEAEVQASIKADYNLVGATTVPATEVATEWKAIKCLSGGAYTAYVYADECAVLEIPEFNIATGSHVEKKDNRLSLLAGANTVQVALEYTKTNNVSGTFDMVEAINEKGEIVDSIFVQNANLSLKETKSTTKSVMLHVPNVNGTYTIKVYSDGNFVASQNVVVQGVATSAKINLNPSVTG